QWAVQIGLSPGAASGGDANPFEVGDQPLDVRPGELNRWRRLGLCGLPAGRERGSPRSDLGDPAGDGGRIPSRVSDRPVLGELRVAVSDQRYKIVVDSRAAGDPV